MHQTRTGPAALLLALLLALPLALPLAIGAQAGSAHALGAAPTQEDAVPAQEDGVWPLDPQPEVVSGFDPPTSRWGAGHRGVDLLGTAGQPVRAAQAGTVTFAGRLAGRGVVVVSHGATRTTYEPVAATVALGDRVEAGTSIGRLELLGSHCLPRTCLHWGLLEVERYLDPLTLVGGGPVRLLPWLGEGAGRTDGSTWTEQATGPVPQAPGWRPLGQAALFRG